MLIGNTYYIGYNFKIVECDEDGNQTVVYFDPDDDIDGVTINILDSNGVLIRELEDAMTKVGDVVGKGYKIKYKPEVEEAKLELIFKKDGDLKRDLLDFVVTNTGESFTECQSDNFFFLAL